MIKPIKNKPTYVYILRWAKDRAIIDVFSSFKNAEKRINKSYPAYSQLYDNEGSPETNYWLYGNDGELDIMKCEIQK